MKRGERQVWRGEAGVNATRESGDETEMRTMDLETEGGRDVSERRNRQENEWVEGRDEVSSGGKSHGSAHAPDGMR